MSSSSSFQLSSRLSKWTLIGFSLLFIFRLGIIFELPFTDTTEARYAEIARKMVETDDWITPQFDYGVPFWGKPPLYTWISAAGMKIFGVNAFGARIGIFIISLLLLFVVFRWAQREKGKDYALAGTFIVASNLLFFLSAANVMTDLVMVAGTTLCMVSFWDSLHQKNKPRWKKYFFFVGLAIGLLAKGPVAVVLCALPIGLWVLLTNNWKATWQKIPWISGILLTLVLSLPWYYLAEQKTPGFLEYFIVGEHFHRFVDSGWKGDLYGHGHAHPKGTIWIYALGTLLPWTPFILWPLIKIKKVTRSFKDEFISNVPQWSLYLLCWAMSSMLFFTMASNILMTYTLSSVPAFGFLAVSLWEKNASQKSSADSRTTLFARFYTVSSVVAVLVPFVAVAGLNFLPRFLEHRSQQHLIETAHSIQRTTPNTSSFIYFWPKRYYSAEFYSGGKAKRLHSVKEVTSLLHNHQRDLLAVREEDLRKLPPDVLRHFTLIKSFRKDHQLYLENPSTH